MTIEEQIRKSISELGRQPVVILTGTIKDVDENAATCTVIDAEDVDKYQVRIKAAVDEKETGLFVFPKVGSSVLIGRIQESNEWVILAYTDFTKLTKKQEKSTYTQDDNFAFENEKCTLKLEDKFTLKNDQTALKDILNEFITEVKNAIINTPSGAGNISPVTQAKLDLIDNKINQLFNA
jgi:hypothetical protein